MEIFEDNLDILEIIQYGFPRQINRRLNYYDEMDNLTFFKTFRLYKNTVIYVLTLIEENLEYPDDRNNSDSPINQLLCTLRFYASSGHLSSVANFMGMHTSTASRIIAKVSAKVSEELYPRFIKMPQQGTLIAEQHKFFEMFGFPRTIGIVDGTHIKMQSPGKYYSIQVVKMGKFFETERFFCSLNVQVTTDANLKFVDVVARWPGPAHDATIFANARLKTRMEAGEFPNCVLLGDSGYPLRDYFLTPLENPANRGEELYKRQLIRARNSVERVIGIWKRQFPIMAYGLRLKINTSMTICIATAILHNLARDVNEPEPPAPEEINIDQLNYLIETENINLPHINEEVPINLTRQEFINYFSLR